METSSSVRKNSKARISGAPSTSAKKSRATVKLGEIEDLPASSAKHTAVARQSSATPSVEDSTFDLLEDIHR